MDKGDGGLRGGWIKEMGSERWVDGGDGGVMDGWVGEME